MYFNPARAYLNVQEKFVHFLLDRTMGAVPRSGEESYWKLTRKQLKSAWLADGGAGAAIYAAPVLEGLFPYPGGAESIDQLKHEGVLENGMEEFIKNEIVTGKYNLYKHQADSIRASGVEGKDIIVSSGTGSGKTECFLYSMINNMLRAKINFDDPGVRVLMIYPRNALVKDQLRRILDMVMGKNPKISVGMYIGETERDEESSMSDWETEMSNRFGENVFTRYYRRTRDEIRKNPPQILITNYSMLEWMMLRDTDQSIFAKSMGKLQAIVLDEAHLYSGALANDINMLIRRTLERFCVSKASIRFYATSATIGDGLPETLRHVASSLFGIEESRVRAITGERSWPEKERPVGGDFVENERKILEDLRDRLVADHDAHGVKPKNFLKLNVDEVRLLAKCSPDVTDFKGACFLPYKLHTFMDIPKMVYSDLSVADEQTCPLGGLQFSPIFPDGVRGVEVYAVTPRSSDECGVYFKAYLEEESCPPFASRLVAVTSDRALRPLYFRRRMDDDSRGFDLVPMPTGGWRVSEVNEKGTFVLAKRNAQGGVWAGAASAEEWLLRDGKTTISTWGDNVGYGSATLVPLAFMPQDMRLTAYTEMLFPELPSAEVPDNSDAENYLYERSWQGRQMLVFSDSRSKAASTAPTLQGRHQQEFVKNCIYRELVEVGGTLAMADISTSIFDRYANEFHLSQNLYGLDENTQDELKRDCLIPSLVYCSLAIASETRSIEEVGAVTHANVVMPCPTTTDQKVLFDRLMIPGNDDPSSEVKMDFWQREVVPAIIELFKGRRAVYFRPAHEQFGREVGNWTKATRSRHEALGTGLGYVWHDLRNGMFLTEQNFVDARKDSEIYRFMAQYFRLVADDENLDLRKSLFSYLKSSAYQLPRNVTDAQLSSAVAFVAIRNWSPAKDCDEDAMMAHGRIMGHAGVALNPYAFRFSAAENENECERASYFYQHVTDLSDGAWGGLSVPEHSAQLQTDVLEDIEANFKDHRLNVISCTPTLEVGIDIGALPVITMANLPPDKAGYLQRAGRAGRGLKATAMITTFLSDSVWDKLVKQDSMSFFKRENVFSVANVESPSVAELVKKHVYLFLLGSFFGEMYLRERDSGGGRGPENPILAWDRVGTFLANAEHLQYHCDCLRRRLKWLDDKGQKGRAKWWRVNTELENVETYLASVGENECPRFKKMQAYFDSKIGDKSFVESFARVIAGTVWAADVSVALRMLVVKLIAELETCSLSLNDKLDELRIARQKIEKGVIADENPNRMNRLKNLLDVQFSALYGEYLISHLTHNRIVPAYGFPIDVLSLVSGDDELQRQKLLAIREFTPGNRIPMGHTYTSVDALAPNYGADDESRYRLWYLVGKCPRCQEEIPPQEIGVGEVHCPYCEHVFVPSDVARMRCIEPTGYRSLKDPVNAALSRKRISYISPDMYLELHSLARFGGVVGGTEPRVCASCHYCESSNPAEMAVLKCVNEGPDGNGFAVHRESGRAVADAPARIWQPEIELSDEERKEKKRVKAWQKNEVGDENDAHYINNASLLCWMQVPTFVVSVQDVAGGALLGTGANPKSLQMLIKMAILRQAAEELKLDSRALACQVQVVSSRNVCHFALYSADGDADCYFSEIEHIVNEQIQTSGENKFLYHALSRIHPSAIESQNDLLAYSNAHEYMLIRDEQFAMAYQWVQNNLHALTHQQLETVNGLTLKNPVDPLMAITKGTGSVLLMFPDLTIADVEEGSVILDVLAKTSSSCEINVVYDKLNGGEKTLSYVTQSRMWSLSQAHNRLKFRPVSLAVRGEFHSLYDSGAHFAVDGHWHFLRTQLVGDEKLSSLSRKSWMEFLSPAIRKSCWSAEGREETLTHLLGLDLLEEPTLPITTSDISPVYTWAGMAYTNLTAGTILKKLGIDTGKITVKGVHYEDRYFMTPKSWIFFSWIMREFRFEHDATIDIVTMPLAEKPNHPILNLFGHTLDRFLVRPTNARILGYAITREDADEFGTHIANKIGIAPSRFVCSYEENPANVAHGREMRIELVDENGNTDQVSILFDSGMDMLRFNLIASYPLFSDALKTMAIYDQRYYIVKGA